jgi:bifunctional DNA-binding transcriptional regulator/antitoxin component of YhaV-PrlF toxin-antitoxin module
MSANAVPVAIVRLRPKNQITLPAPQLKELGAAVGDRFLLSVDTNGLRLEPVRASYAGALEGVWSPNWQEELRRERDSWQP